LGVCCAFSQFLGSKLQLSFIQSRLIFDIVIAQLRMSLEEEDNSPFGEGSLSASITFTPPTGDDFTELPLDEDKSEKTESSVADKSPIPDNSSATEHSDAAQPKVSTNTVAYDPEAYSTTLQHSFKDKSAVTIEIVDAGKSHEGQSRGYIVYTIKCNDYIVRRRYSEFESLRKSLVRLFPTLFIPPIPEKHAISKYAAAPTKAREDLHIIEHRRRMLTVFLNRCLHVDQIRESSVYQDFLDPNANWSEVLVSPPLSDIPKSILQANPLDPANTSAAHSYLPIPSTTTIPSKSTGDDVKFNHAENRAREYEAVISTGVEKISKRLIRHLSELGSEDSEAGGAFNAFSLQEVSPLAQLLEKVGQAYDNSYASTELLVDTLNHEFTEPLGESVQLASVVKETLKFRQQKSLQLDITARTLKHKLNQLKLLEKSEEETKRIERAIEVGEGKTGQINFDRKVAARKAQEEQQGQGSEGSLPDTNTGITPLEPKKPSFKIPGISKITNFVKESIDADPEAQLKQNMTKLKGEINQLKQTFNAAASDLKDVTDALNTELGRFQKTKEEDQKKMILAYSRCILDWSHKNLEFWEDIRSQY
jgi:hypothetical protein